MTGPACMSREKNRRDMPTVAQIVDDFRPFLGKVIYASENGHTHGEPSEVDPAKVFTIPKDYYPCRTVETKK